MMMSSLLALGLAATTANACTVLITVICPNDNTAAGINVCVTSTSDSSTTACGVTDQNGFVSITMPQPDKYQICVDTTTLPAGATLKKSCQTLFVPDIGPGVSVEFTLGGDFCTPPHPPGPCWMTGGGNIGNGKTPEFSYGGVVNPGCSATAAGGGNWNVIDHNTDLHFQGQLITVDDCYGAATRSPRVSVRVIEFHGTGIIGGIGGNPDATIPVSFVGQAIDNHDGGAGSDQLYLQVTDASGNIWLQIGTGNPVGVGPITGITPVTVSVGNIQIHQSSCGN